MIFRQSTLKRWMSCPLQAYFAEFAGLPEKPGSKATFGSCIHAALNHYNLTGDIDRAISLFQDAWEDPQVLGLPQIVTWNKFTSYGGLRQRGIEILRVYHDRMRWEQRTVIAAEHQFRVPFGKHELTGTVDLVSVRQNHKGKQLLMIEDYKTNTKRPTVAELSLNIQFTVYIYALLQPEFWYGDKAEMKAVVNADWYREMTVDMPRRGLWVHLWDQAKELDAGGRDDHDFARLYRLCNEIERAVEHSVYVPNIGDPCLFCDYAHDPCPQDPPPRSYWEDERIEADPNSWTP